MNDKNSIWFQKCSEFDLKIQKLWENEEYSEAEKISLQQEMLNTFNSDMLELKMVLTI